MSSAAVNIGSTTENRIFQDSFKVKIFGIDISHQSVQLQFIVCSTGVFVCYLLYGYFQELIFAQPSIKSYGLYLTFYQFLLYSIFAFFEFFCQTNRDKKIPMRTYIIISFLTVSTMALSNISLEYLNFQTQVIFKSCKLIPVLLGGILIQKKKYGLADFLSAAVMCIGLIWFTLADSKVSPNFHLTGVVLISLALLADAAIGNVQEKALKRYGASTCEVVLYSYSIGLVFLGLALLSTGQLIPSIIVAYEYPYEMYGYGFLYSVSGYLGANLVLTLVRTAGAFAAVSVTTFRKALTIAISFFVFPKPFTMQYVWSGVLVLLGVYLNSASKQKSSPFSLFSARLSDYLCAVYYRVSASRKSKTSNMTLKV